MLSVIIPASNEAAWIGPCLQALLASAPVPGGAEVIVVANGCRDDTAARARDLEPVAQARGWRLTVIERIEGGKAAALNAGDAAAQGEFRAYLDADVTVGPTLMAQLVLALSRPEPCYATGRAVIPRARSGVTRAYARFWLRLPFAAGEAPGMGLFAVNAAGRARWGPFPGIISDDTFVRLLFQPAERVQVAATYTWPMIEGFASLVRVRRRQDAGVAEIAARYPQLLANEAKPPPTRRWLAVAALRDPAGFAVYAAVTLTVRMGAASGDWTRGR
jgi:glycosyltransferase involved in cell wall biosynthesis